MNVDNELTDYGAAGSLAEELPWWGWLEDGRSCLTRAGELMSIGRMTPARIDHRFGNEGHFGRPERLTPVSLSRSGPGRVMRWCGVNGAFFGFGRA